jgi:excisionase family DNA binding protein
MSTVISKKLLLDYQAVSEWLGIKPQTLRRWVSEGHIPCIKLSGRCVRFDAVQIEHFIEKHSKHVGGGRL